MGSFLLFEPVELEKLPNAVERTEPPSPREVGGVSAAGALLIGRAVARVMGAYSRARGLSPHAGTLSRWALSRWPLIFRDREARP